MSRHMVDRGRRGGACGYRHAGLRVQEPHGGYAGDRRSWGGGHSSHVRKAFGREKRLWY